MQSYCPLRTVRTKKERGGRKARAEGEGAWIRMRASFPDSQMSVVRPVRRQVMEARMCTAEAKAASAWRMKKSPDGLGVVVVVVGN